METPSNVMTRSSRYPQLAETWNKTGTAFKNSGRYAEAIKCYDTAIDINSKYADAFYNKGIALARVGCDADAAAAFAKAKELEANASDHQEASMSQASPP